MHISEWLPLHNKTQADLALVIGQNKMLPKHRVRAHRLFHGLKPNDQEMALIKAAWGENITADYFYKRPKKVKHARPVKPARLGSQA